MADFNKSLWAPWRMDYIRSLDEEEKEHGCFLCHYWKHPEQDRENRVLWRTDTTFVVLNRFPYTNGHLLVAHAGHLSDLTELNDTQLDAMTRAMRDAVILLRKAVSPQGLNVGYNLGQCAGAGLPGHLHAHVVPRWNGDTNFMTVLGGIRVIPDALDATFLELAKHVDAIGLR